jgi:hypothetical protein
VTLLCACAAPANVPSATRAIVDFFIWWVIVVYLSRNADLNVVGPVPVLPPARHHAIAARLPLFPITKSYPKHLLHVTGVRNVNFSLTT